MEPGDDLRNIGVDLLVQEGGVDPAPKGVGDEGFDLAGPREYAGGDVLSGDPLLHENRLIVYHVQQSLVIDAVDEDDAPVAASAQRLGD